jgi:hypothetical protein
MMFRRLYWVTELIDSDDRSKVVGVYTSIPDLIRHGLEPLRTKSDSCIRLTLTKLDCSKGPLATWCSPSFEGLADGLQEFVETEEFSEEQCRSLVEKLKMFERNPVQAGRRS